MENLIGKLCLTPSKTFLLYANEEKSIGWDLRKIIPSENFRNQYVLVIDSIGNSPGDLFFKVLFKGGRLVWMHNFDLIRIDQNTREPILSTGEL